MCVDTIRNNGAAEGLRHHHRQGFLGKSLDAYATMRQVALQKDEAPKRFKITTKGKGVILDAGDIIVVRMQSGIGIDFTYQ